MQRAYSEIAPKLRIPPIIHIVGTNGKGSTGRFLAGAIKEAGYKVGHYTSPHIFRFNERIWIDGKEISDERLDEVHSKAQKLLDDQADELSYFEYTTFLAILAFEQCDYVVMEAGLGGEYDATSVFPNILTLVTPIDYDHSDFLGENIEEIARTKLKAVQKGAIMAPQLHVEVYEVAQKLQISYKVATPSKELERIVETQGLAPFFTSNLALALEGAKALGIVAHPSKVINYRLPGRMQKIGNVTLDVGHNLLSAKAISNLIEPGTILVYNTYADKEYEKILQTLAPKIAKVEILPVANERIVDENTLIKTLQRLGLQYSYFDGIKRDKKYLVYGSFSVVEEFMKRCGQNIMNI